MKRRIFGLAFIGLAVVSVGWTAHAASTDSELRALEHTWKDAVVARHAATLQRLYAAEFTSTDQEGAVWNKSEASPT